MASPHESIPASRSSQCRMPLWHAPMKQSHRLVQPVSGAPISCPINQSQIRPVLHSPWCAPTNQSHHPDAVARPHDTSPSINPIALIQPVSYATMAHPINQSHRPIQPTSISHSNALILLKSLTDHITYITFLELPIMNSPAPTLTLTILTLTSLTLKNLTLTTLTLTTLTLKTLTTLTLTTLTLTLTTLWQPRQPWHWQSWRAWPIIIIIIIPIEMFKSNLND